MLLLFHAFRCLHLLLTLLSEMVEKENGSIKQRLQVILSEDIDSILANLVQEKGPHVVVLAYQVNTRTKN